jgi:hypothetical protein
LGFNRVTASPQFDDERALIKLFVKTRLSSFNISIAVPIMARLSSSWMMVPIGVNPRNRRLNQLTIAGSDCGLNWDNRELHGQHGCKFLKRAEPALSPV